MESVTRAGKYGLLGSSTPTLPPSMPSMVSLSCTGESGSGSTSSLSASLSSSGSQASPSSSPSVSVWSGLVVAGQLSLGDLVLVNTMMLQLFMPLGFLGVIYRALRYSLADMDLVFRLLEERPEVRDLHSGVELEVSEPVLVFDGVSFAYTPERPILHDVSFRVPSGTKVAVVGPSGAGKSTLARLLFRFYEVDSGRILIGSQDIARVTQASLRQAVGIVPQDTVLFNDTILHNISYASPGADFSEIVAAASVADIHSFIESLPEGYQTVVGERGLKLSGGEKQRIAIARMVLKKPRIMVFDEATSSLDSQSEKNILAALNRVSQDVTTLVIAHRLSTVVDADESRHCVNRGPRVGVHLLIAEHQRVGRVMARPPARQMLPVVARAHAAGARAPCTCAP